MFLKELQGKANLLLTFWMANFGHFGLKFVSAQILTDNEFISYSEIGEFQKIVGGFIDMVDALAKEVEKEKMKVGLFLHVHCLYL